MLQKGSKSYSIFHLKCPRCHEGEMFETGSWSFKKSFDMYQRCPKCNLNYFPEPGYYYGSMFISYIWLAWVSLLSVMFFHWYLKLDELLAYALLILVVAINFVYIFRISRLMWINMHVKYDPKAIEKYQLDLAAKS
ncbi:MAG TPA: DUF983 domain-containing protein [Saprospirales bacterium]|nr:DUF983 domain-containing protein [Saprospirales bacterium]